MQIDLIHSVSDRLYQLTLTELQFINKKIEAVMSEFTKTLNILIKKIDELKK